MNKLKYNQYNREERAISTHLFRLLHEDLDKAKSPFLDFIEHISNARLNYKNGEPEYGKLGRKNKSIYCEVALIRDKYFLSKPHVSSFMDDLIKIVMKQERVGECRFYSQLPTPLNDPQKTHPKQIKQKANSENIELSNGEKKVYGAIQSMFNAKPDLVLTVGNLLLVGEVKFTEVFNKQQIERTWNIAEVWANLLYEDLGFSEPPTYTVFKLGAEKFSPDMNWQQIHEISKIVYNNNDRSRMAFKSGLGILTKL